MQDCLTVGSFIIFHESTVEVQESAQISHVYSTLSLVHRLVSLYKMLYALTELQKFGYIQVDNTSTNHLSIDDKLIVIISEFFEIDLVEPV